MIALRGMLTFVAPESQHHKDREQAEMICTLVLKESVCTWTLIEKLLSLVQEKFLS